MTTKNTSIPETLNRHLSAVSHEDIASVARYIDLGAGLVTPDAINALRRLGRSLDKKIAGLGESERLRRRIELLATYFEEACLDGQKGSPAHREVAFALLYFLKGFDRIPDTIPEVGLLDDAMVVQIVLDRHASVLRAHWLRQRRVWPAEF